MLHLTLNTGHARQSPRSEVRDDVIAQLRPMVRAGGGENPGPTPGYHVAIAREGRDATFTVTRDTVRVLTAGVAIEQPARVWEALLALAPMARLVGVDKVSMPDEAPWLAVVVHDFSYELHWLADFERCLAWTLLDGADA